MSRYFLTIPSENNGKEQEVTLERYCQEERRLGFFPKMSRQDPLYMKTPATASFGGGGVHGRTEYKSAHSDLMNSNYKEQE